VPEILVLLVGSGECGMDLLSGAIEKVGLTVISVISH